MVGVKIRRPFAAVAVIAIVAVLAGLGAVALLGRSHDARAFCHTLARVNGRDTTRVLAALPPSTSNQLVILTTPERHLVGALFYDVTTALHQSPLPSLTADLLDYQVRLRYAVSALQIRNAIDRFHAFTRVSAAQTCPANHP